MKILFLEGNARRMFSVELENKVCIDHESFIVGFVHENRFYYPTSNVGLKDEEVFAIHDRYSMELLEDYHFSPEGRNLNFEGVVFKGITCCDDEFKVPVLVPGNSDQVDSEDVVNPLPGPVDPSPIVSILLPYNSGQFYPMGGALINAPSQPLAENVEINIVSLDNTLIVSPVVRSTTTVSRVVGGTTLSKSAVINLQDFDFDMSQHPQFYIQVKATYSPTSVYNKVDFFDSSRLIRGGYTINDFFVLDD